MRLLVPMSAKERARGEASPYLQGLRAGGAAPEEILPLAPGEVPPSQFDGLLLTGGADVEPSRYGEEQRAGNLKIDPERDRLDFPLLDRAIQAQVPILAICRGLQVVNVAFGGTLYQDLLQDQATDRSHRENDRAALVHEVEVVDSSSLLSRLIPTPCAVNSLHHQAARTQSSRLRVTARSIGDGLIEGLEPAFSYPWLLAVQWHPEELLHDPRQRRLFEAFVNACRSAVSS